MTLWDKFWRDKNGKVVIWQSPNLAITTWFVAAIVARFIKTGQLHDAAQGISSVAILVWAILEIFQGASHFRRLLGAVVLAVSFNGLIMRI